MKSREQKNTPNYNTADQFSPSVLTLYSLCFVRIHRSIIVPLLEPHKTTNSNNWFQWFHKAQHPIVKYKQYSSHTHKNTQQRLKH